MRRALFFWTPLLLYMLAVFLVSVSPNPPKLPEVWAMDKIAHFGAYAVMGLLWARALDRGPGRAGGPVGEMKNSLPGETFCRKVSPAPPSKTFSFPADPQELTGGGRERTGSFWREFERNFLQKGSLKRLFHRPVKASGRAALAVAVTALFGVFIEVCQGYVPGRRADALDALANGVGGFLGVYIHWRIMRRLRRPSF